MPEENCRPLPCPPSTDPAHTPSKDFKFRAYAHTIYSQMRKLAGRPRPHAHCAGAMRYHVRTWRSLVLHNASASVVWRRRPLQRVGDARLVQVLVLRRNGGAREAD